jgi:hypothetical protein
MTKVNSTSASRARRSFSTSVQQPNRFTRAFQIMKDTCPKDISAYAKCVAKANEDGTLTKSVCQEEFANVKQCFQKARKSIR